MYAARRRTMSRRRAISARVASSFCWVASISVASWAMRWVAWSTCAFSCASIAWFWLTWLARAANASGSGLGVVDVGASLEVVLDGPDVDVSDGVVVEGDDEVVVDDSWATAALAGTGNTLTRTPATSPRT